MKKHLLLLLTSLACLTANAQEIWIEAGLKGGFGTSFLLNKNIADDRTYDYKITTMYGVGGKLSVNFGPYHGIAIEGLYNQAGQDFEYQLDGTQGDLENNIDWKSIDAYLLYRYIRNRVYVEVGPMYSLVRSVKQQDNGVELTDTEDFYEKNYLAGVFGFGGYIAGAETFSVGLGLRLSYGLGDFVSEAGREGGYPNPVHQNVYESPKNTHPIYGQFLVEFNFGIGHFAKTSCTERMKFFGAGRRR
jgi:hypothetical protein